MASKKDERESASADGNGAEQLAETGRQSAERARRSAEAATEAAARTSERGFSQVADIGRRQADQVRSLMGNSARVYSDVGNVSRDDVDALVQSGARLAKGMQEVSWEVVKYTQQSMQMGMKAANEIMTCRTVDDLLNVQRNFMRQSVDNFLQESARLLEISSDVASEAVNPLSDRIGEGTRQ
ncbi:phasin family protein [Magnetospirillum sp. UT-4]|uniref:phasin family protein n=1 Tax=Magnetospirillum sp. UT-4 TaxID=2681467 RepID=UPI0013805F91|nr:phasin family protein [Magnetospirillum sp. UT-4]CAA7619869.1 hypothetical protein MTBUT4_330008 [Magnetospirillum sp. UT-4]